MFTNLLKPHKKSLKNIESQSEVEEESQTSISRTSINCPNKESQKSFNILPLQLLSHAQVGDINRESNKHFLKGLVK